MRNAKRVGTQTSMEWPYRSFLYCVLDVGHHNMMAGAILYLIRILFTGVNCSVLNKAGFINILFRILSNCGHKRVTTLK